jgi:hypothetical protein
MSHTRLDEEFCNKFDIAAARIGVKGFRSEFEDLETPAWKTIKDEMDKSCALFLLVGRKLVESQSSSEFSAFLPEKDKWKYTQNWIAYEIGLACQRGIDVWVVCDSTQINFPVPYLNNYEIWGIRPADKENLKFWKRIFNEYSNAGSFPISEKWKFPCPSCGAIFNFYSAIKEGGSTLCPTCLKPMLFNKGWPLPQQE